jgi:para-aminobenzoate synthetase component 1
VFGELNIYFCRMDWEPEKHYLIRPLDKEGKAEIFVLAPSNQFSSPGVVLIPYANPQKEKITPAFFSITKSAIIQLTEKNTPGQIQLKPSLTKEEYLSVARELRRQIGLGNIYEINFCLRFYAEDIRADAVGIFMRHLRNTRAPYCMLLRNGNEYIICGSPELFLEKKGNRLSTKPIKGTARRGNSPEADRQLLLDLQNSLKERTEHVMAVDVARNDLSQIAARGSVSVEKLYDIETFETVHQMVSTVSCELKEGTTFENIIGATFPMASMTGAPKLSAMTLIDRHETFTRNCYSGALGLVDKNSDFRLAVLIRSIFYNQSERKLWFATGGAITWLSDPGLEYEECLLKAESMRKSLGL